MRDEPGPEIVTTRLMLSRIAHGDVDELVAMLLKPELHQYIGGQAPSASKAGAQVRRWLSGSPDPSVVWVNYVARHCNDGGFVGLAQATVRRANGTGTGFVECELAYLVNPPEQHNGLGTEMMRGFYAELRATMRPAEFIAHIFPGHAASEGIAKALGLTPTADLVDGERVWRAATPPVG